MPQRQLTLFPKIDVGSLLEKYPHLRTLTSDGQFDHTKSLNQYNLTEAILQEYFGVHVSLDRTKLCPRVPNRMEYLKICENLVEDIDPKTPFEWVIDVGTGSSLIFPLIGTTISSLKYIGTEIDHESLKHAQSTIDRNGLSSLIHLVEPPADTLLPCDKLVNVIKDGHVKYTVCNPPFYKDKEDYIKHQEKKLNPSLMELSISDSELFTTGGEYQFIVKLILDSMALAKLPQFEFTWFTSMVGIYANVKRLRTYVNALLKKKKIANFAFAEISFKTKRWVLAWNFCNWKPTCLGNVLLHLNRRDIVGLSSKNNYSPFKIAQVLENSFSKILQQYPMFAYTLQISRKYKITQKTMNMVLDVENKDNINTNINTNTNTKKITDVTDSSFLEGISSPDKSDPVLLVQTNAPVWTRSFRRKFLRKDSMSFDSKFCLKVTPAIISLMYGDEANFKSFVSNLIAMISEKSAQQNI